MYHFPDYIQAIHVERLREAEAARRANAFRSRRPRRPFLVRRQGHRWRRSRAPNPA